MRRKYLVSFGLVLLLSVLIWKSPDEAYWQKPTLWEGVKVCKTYAWYLLRGDVNGLIRLSIEQAATKAASESTKFLDIPVPELLTRLKQLNLRRSLIGPVLLTEKNQLELVSLNRIGYFLVVTFAYSDGVEIVNVPGRGPMVFCVTARCYVPPDSSVARKIIRKIANLPLIRKFSGNLGRKERWVVLDYRYTYNLADYYRWLLKQGEAYSRTQSALLDSATLSWTLGLANELWELACKRLNLVREWSKHNAEEQVRTFQSADSLLRAVGVENHLIKELEKRILKCG